VYQPGNATGVQVLLTEAEDATLIVILAGRSMEFRNWIEQITAYSTSDLEGRPVIAGVSARVEPDYRAYYDSTNQLHGAVVGLVGAASYESSLSAAGGDGGVRERTTDFHLQSLTLAHLAVAGLMVVGALVFLIRGRGR
jgi:hypothetical protein